MTTQEEQSEVKLEMNRLVWRFFPHKKLQLQQQVKDIMEQQGINEKDAINLLNKKLGLEQQITHF